MQKYGFIVLVAAAAIYMSGCGKKEKPVADEMAVSMESLTEVPAESVAPQVSQPPQAASVSAPLVSQGFQSLPPVGPYKPAVEQIQTALKNAGYYSGKIDGNSGPMTKAAIKEFQKANSLNADGKVGQKTWAALNKYLNSAKQQSGD